jgi:CBS domain-containing protein
VVATATAAESVHEAAKRMEENNVGCLVIVDEATKPLGIVTDRDIVTRAVVPRLQADETPLSVIMTAEPRSVDESTSIEQAVATMGSVGIRRLVVTGDEGVLVGLLSMDDVVVLIVEEAESIGKLLAKEASKIMASV